MGGTMIRQSCLCEYINHYAATHTEQLSLGYLEQLHVAVRLLCRQCGKHVRLSELRDELINDYCDWLTSIGRAPDTVRGRRNCLLTLWRDAYQQEVLETRPDRIRKIRARRQVPRAWTHEQVCTLVRSALQDSSLLSNGIPRGLWLASLIAAGWDTALRLGDLLAMPSGDFAPSSPFVVQQHKTGDDVVVSLSDTTVHLIHRCIAAGETRQQIWPLWAGREQFFVQMRKLVKRSGVPAGTFKWVRRGAITDVEAAGGNGSLLAGHRSRAVTEGHYLDTQILCKHQRRPQPLE